MILEPEPDPVEPDEPDNAPEPIQAVSDEVGREILSTMTREEIRDDLAESLIAEGNPRLLSKVVADIYATLAVSDLPATTEGLRNIIDQLGAFFGGAGPGKMLGRLMKGKDKS